MSESVERQTTTVQIIGTENLNFYASLCGAQGQRDGTKTAYLNLGFTIVRLIYELPDGEALLWKYYRKREFKLVEFLKDLAKLLKDLMPVVLKKVAKNGSK